MTTFLTTTSSITTNNLTNNLTNTNTSSSTPRTTTGTTCTNNVKENSSNDTSTNSTAGYLAKYPNFSKCVSFNNLHPQEYESDFPYTTPIYNLNNQQQQQQSHHSGSFFDSNYTFGSSNGSSSGSGLGSTPKIFMPFQDFNFGNNSNNSSNNNTSSGVGRRHSTSAGTTATSFIKRKRLKLPPPPAKSILKNKVSQQQVEYNNMFENISEATIEYHKQEREQEQQQEEDNDDDNSQSGSNGGSGNSSVNSSPLLTATNITTPISDIKDNQAPPPSSSSSSSRRKSLVGLTDEELMALDPQFQTTKSKNHDLNKFKFDNQKTYYLSPSTRKGSTTDNTMGNVGAGIKRPDYPTSNENNYKSISLTVRYGETTHNDYTRTLLTIISGRRHTWHSLDWLFHIKQDLQNQPTLLADGDYLVIAGLIPIKFIKDYNNNNNNNSTNKKRKLAVEDYLYQKCSNLLNYLMEYISQLNLKLKITVEFVIDYENESDGSIMIDDGKFLKGEKYMIDHLFKQYQPNLIIIGNKSSNLNFKYPVKMNKLNNLYLIKLSSYIVKYSTIPVILVGLLIGINDDNSNSSASNSVSGGGGGGVKFNKPTITFSISKTPSSELTPKHSQTTTNKNSSSSSSSPDLSDSSSDSDSDNSSIESIESLTPKEYTDEKKRQKIFNEKLTTINNLPFNSSNKYQDWLSTISDNSLQASKNYLYGINSKDDSIIIDDKIHAIYKSQTWNVNSGSLSHDDILSDSNSTSMYKVKSLISIEDDEEVKRKQEEIRLKKRNNKRNSSVKSIGSGNNGGVSGFIHSIKSNDNNSIISSGGDNKNKMKNVDKSTKRKSSIWKKLGFSKK
ncbi:hypothetical protein L150_04383 [Candida albicans Ca529L]|nr:hypothetical protein L150_04383 [Candida albicans Ca529L]